MLKVRHFEMSCQILAHLDFMRATHSKKVGTGSNKRPEKLNVHIRNSWRTNLQLIRSLATWLGIKRASQSGSLSQKSRWEEDHQFPNAAVKNSGAISERSFSEKIAKSLKLSSSTVHNIIQRFRESGTISVRKGQGRKTILDARDLRALRRHCITYRNATVMEITTWAQEYFQKTLSVNTIHRAIRRCRLNSIGQKEAISKHDPEAQAFLWAKLI